MIKISFSKESINKYIQKKIARGYSLDEIRKYALESLKKDQYLSTDNRAKKYNCSVERVHNYDWFMGFIIHTIDKIKKNK